MTAYDDNNIFAKILRGEIPCVKVYEDDHTLAFMDVMPQAPGHLLVIPKTPDYRDVTELAAADPALLAEVVQVAHQLAAEHASGDFRLIFNTGADAGQTVFHVHAHVLCGDLDETSMNA